MLVLIILNSGGPRLWFGPHGNITVILKIKFVGFPGGPVVKNPSCNAGATGSIPGPGGSHMPLSLCATATEPVSHSYGAHPPEPVLPNKRSEVWRAGHPVCPTLRPHGL